MGVGPDPLVELGHRYEIVGGRRVALPTLTPREHAITLKVDGLLGDFAWTHRLGHVATGLLFPIGPPADCFRRPDISFDRWPMERRIYEDDPWVRPDLAVEVIGPHDLAGELLSRVGEYLLNDVRRVWVIFPCVSRVYVYKSWKQCRILGIGDELDGEEILPGFRLSLAELFEDGA
jgi:Uma2 family endonuclease